jgi:hypothetical protein
MAETGIVAGEAAQAHGRKGVHDGIEPVHPGPVQAKDAQHGDNSVNAPEALGGLRHARGQLRVLHRSRRLGLEHLAAADAEQRQDRHRQHDQAHAAEPDHHAAPEVDRRRHLVEVGQHRRTGGGQAGHGLEIGVGK